MIRRLTLCLAALLVAGCSSIDAAITQAGRSAAANWGHVRDVALSDQAHAIASANAIAWDAQYFALTGEWRSETAKAKCYEAFGVKTDDELLLRFGGD